MLGRLAQRRTDPLALGLVAFLVSVTPPLVVSAWMANAGHLDSRPQGVPRLTIWRDFPSIILLIGASASFALMVHQWRLMSTLLKNLSDKGALELDETARHWLQVEVARINRFYSRMGRWPLKMMLLAASLGAAVLTYGRVSGDGFYNFLMPGSVEKAGHGSVEAWEAGAVRQWWASSRPGEATWIALFSLATFFIAIQVIAGARFLVLSRLVSSRLNIGLNFDNPDGAFGRADVRQLLVWVYIGLLVYVVLAFDLVVIVRGHESPLIVLLVAPFLVLNALYLVLPLKILHRHASVPREHYVMNCLAALQVIDHGSLTERHLILTAVDRAHSIPGAIFPERTFAAAALVYTLPSFAAFAQIWDVFLA